MSRESWDDRNALARQCADLRDENDDLRRRLREAQEVASRESVRFAALSIAAEDDDSLTTERIDQIADEVYSAVDRRYWS